MSECDHKLEAAKGEKGHCPVCDHTIKGDGLKCSKCGVMVHDKDKCKKKLTPSQVGHKKEHTKKEHHHPPAQPPPKKETATPGGDDAKEIEEEFNIIRQKCNIPADVAAAMSFEQKKELVRMNASMIAESRQNQATATSSLQNVGHCVTMLRQNMSVELMTEVGIILRSSSVDWVESFLDTDGIAPILQKLKQLCSPTSRPDAKMEDLCLSAIKSIMNNPSGLRSFALTKNAVKILAVCLSSKTISDKQRIICVHVDCPLHV